MIMISVIYMIMISQSLYHNLLIQDAIMNINTSASPVTDLFASLDPQLMVVIKELQICFGYMRLSKYGIINLSSFIGSSYICISFCLIIITITTIIIILT
jgi:hypothetical protein